LKEEEEEAKRLQEEKISGMREEDFLDDFNSFSSQISKTQKVNFSFSKKKKKSRETLFINPPNLKSIEKERNSSCS